MKNSAIEYGALVLIILLSLNVKARGDVSSGSSSDLDLYRAPYSYALPSGQTTEDIVGMGIAGSNDHIYVWYKDGTVSSGTSSDLDQYRAPYSYSLPPGKTPGDVAGIGIAGSNDYVYVWYKDGTVSSGTSADLDHYRAPYSYTLPPGKAPGDIVGIGIAGSNDHIYVWYKDGTVSSGTSSDLDYYRAPYSYTLTPGKTPDDIIGMGIAGSNDHVFVWTKFEPDFTNPYKGVKPAAGERPLLVILLEPDDTEMRDQINVYALKEDGYIGQTIVGIESSGKLTGWHKPPKDIPMPETRRFTSAPAVLNSADGNLQSVFALGEDGYIYQAVHSRISEESDWTNWTSWSALPMTRKFKSAPAAINSPDGSLASVFALGQDDYIYQIVYSRRPGSGWHDWLALPKTIKFKSAPAAINSPNGSLASVFALGQDDYIYQIVYSRGPGSGWHDWVALPKTRKFKSAPAAINSPDGTVASVFALGQDDYIYQIVYSRGTGSGWHDWVALPKTQQFNSAPAVMNSAAGNWAAVYALGKDGYIYEAIYTRGPGSHWSSWFKIPGSVKFSSAPAVNPRLAHIRAREYYRKMIFSATSSVRGYFLENSYGKFTFKEAFVTAWLKAQDDPSTADWDESSFEFIHTYPSLEKKSAWVIQQVEKMTSFRFKDYDVDHDGKITTDELCILWIYSGGGDARARGTDPSPVPVPSLSQGVETHWLIRGGAGMSMATIAHELGHQAFKLPDMYPDGVHPGVDRFSLMGNQAGGSHLDAWSKMKLGWLMPKVVTQSGWHTLNDAEKHPEAYILYNPSHGNKEYFIVENRWPGISYEKNLIDRGLAIWRIDESYQGGNWGRITIHLVRAAGATASAKEALWDGSDTQTGYDLTSNSSPSNSRWRDGSSSGISIKSIPVAGAKVKVFFEVP